MKEDFKSLMSNDKLEENDIKESQILYQDEHLNSNDINTPNSALKKLKMSKISSSLSTLVDSEDYYDLLAKSEEGGLKSIYGLDSKVLSKNISFEQKLIDSERKLSINKFKTETKIIPRNLNIDLGLGVERRISHELDLADKEYSDLISKKFNNYTNLNFNFKSMLNNNISNNANDKVYQESNMLIFNGNKSNLLDNKIYKDNLSVSKCNSEELFTNNNLIRNIISEKIESKNDFYNSRIKNRVLKIDERDDSDNDFFEDNDSDSDSDLDNDNNYDRFKNHNKTIEKSYVFSIFYYIPNTVQESLVKKSKSHVFSNHLNLNQNYLVANFKKEKIDLEMNPMDKIKDLISKIIISFNSDKKNKLKLNSNLKYTLRPSKKTGFPNFDMPCKIIFH